MPAPWRGEGGGVVDAVPQHRGAVPGGAKFLDDGLLPRRVGLRDHLHPQSSAWAASRRSPVSSSTRSPSRAALHGLARAGAKRIGEGETGEPAPPSLASQDQVAPSVTSGAPAPARRNPTDSPARHFPAHALARQRREILAGAASGWRKAALRDAYPAPPARRRSRAPDPRPWPEQHHALPFAAGRWSACRSCRTPAYRHARPPPAHRRYGTICPVWPPRRARQNRRRGGEPHGAGAGNDQHRNGVDDGAGIGRAMRQPSQQREQRQPHHHRHEHGRHLVRQLLHARLGRLRVLDHPCHAVEEAFPGGGGHPQAQHRFQVQRASQQLRPGPRVTGSASPVTGLSSRLPVPSVQCHPPARARRGAARSHRPAPAATGTSAPSARCAISGRSLAAR